jgi:molecular chaperone GrpE
MSDEFSKKDIDHKIKEPEVDTDLGDDVVFEDNTEVTGIDHKKKTDQLKARIKELETKSAEYLDNWQRDKAEFINARKRDEASQQEFLKFSNEKLVLDIIPVLDSFDVAIEHASEVSDEFKKGIESISNQLLSILNKNGVQKFSPKGEDFDPSRAQAIGTVKGDHGKVVEVIQVGYELNGKVIRPAMVKVGDFGHTEIGQ